MPTNNELMLSIYKDSVQEIRHLIVGYNHDPERFLQRVSQVCDRIEPAEQAFWGGTNAEA